MEGVGGPGRDAVQRWQAGGQSGQSLHKPGSCEELSWASALEPSVLAPEAGEDHLEAPFPALN